jgi:hypothetical protein
MARRVLASAILGAAAIVAAVLALPSPAYSHKPITTNILFKNEVAQIFQRKCFQCHTENNLAMSLLTYTEARPWARAIREEILERRMPPWTAVPGYGHFSNDISLTARELDIVVSWADGGAPSGVLKVEESIPPVYVPPAPAWDHGAPDRVVPIGEGQTIEAAAPLATKRFTIDTNLPKATRVRGIALKQGDRRVVRHAAVYDAASGRWLGSWTPWQTASMLPPGLAHRLPAKARLIVEIDYSGTEETVTDKSELGLYVDASARQSTDVVLLTAPELTLPSATAAHRVRTETRLAQAVSVVALWPNPTPNARSIEISAATPDGMMTPLLWVKDYRPDWRSPYYLSHPVPLPRGTRLVMTTYFDNATDKAVKARAEAWVTTAP